MRATIPEPLAVVRRGAVTATVESFLPGERLYTRWQRFGYTGSDRIEDLELVTEWLIAFHGQSLVETRRWGTREIDECVESPIRDYEAAFGATPAEAELFDRARAYARNVLELDLPVVWRHGDFLSINILRSNRSIRVVDWEHAEPGLPLDDLLYFARGVAVTPRRRGQARDPREPTVAAFRRLFAQPDGRDSVVGAVRAAVATYMEKLELDERLYPLVLLHGSVRRAVERLERELLTNAGGGPDTPNLYVRCVRVLAERPELLFP
jgi:aminoglycoside phosphotransferase (APT) family kinase protein